MILGSSASGQKKMAAIFRFVGSARSNAGHAQKNISGDRQTGNYPTFLLDNNLIEKYIKRISTIIYCI